MRKQEFLEKLRASLFGMPKQELEERISFYSEMIDDRIEEGFDEEDAVLQVGSVEKISEQIIAQASLTKIAKERKSPQRRLSAGEILLLILGSPIWLSLVIAVFAVILSLYVLLWTLIISLWAAFVSFVACFVGSVLACVVFNVGGNGASGIAILAAGIIFAGLSIFMFYGCKAVTDGTVKITKEIAICIKSYFLRKVEA